MESNTETTGLAVLKEKIVGNDWSKLAGEFGSDLEETARRCKALVRERKVNGAANLLRLILAYAVCDWSLRLVGAWACTQEVAKVSDVALLYRFRQSYLWLGVLIGCILQRRNQELVQAAGVRVRLIDATVVSRPGSTGTDWRIHVGMDLEHICLDEIEVTDAKSGESLTRFEPRGDEIWIGDRGYSVANGIGHLLAKLGRLILRVNWNSLPMLTETEQRFKLIDWLKYVQVVTERLVWIPTPQGMFLVRLLVCPLPAPQAEKARERVRKQAAKKGRPLNQQTWLAAGYVILITNLPAETWEVARIFWLYRLRWQVELQFKRLKSLLFLDHLRAQDPRLARTYLFAKLLLALLLDELILQTQEQLPDWYESVQRPVSVWRLQAFLWAAIRNLICGTLSIPKIMAALPALQRYFRDSHRNRCQQLAWARSIIHRLSLAGV